MRIQTGRVLLPLGRPVAIGPKQTVARIIPVRVEGRGVRGIVPISQTKGLFVSASLSEACQVRVQLFNSATEARMLAAKLCLVAVLLMPDARVEIEQEEAETLCNAEDTEAQNHDWTKRYPRVFAEPTFDQDDRASDLEVTRKEIEWRIPFDEIQVANRGIEYGRGDISPEEASETLRTMERQGVIRRMHPDERALFSPDLWVRKTNGSVRPTIDLRLVNQYSETWRNVNPGVLATLRQIPHHWRVFTLLDLAQGFFHSPIDRDLQQLFGFEWDSKRWTYRVLPMGWSSTLGLFSSRVRSILEDTESVTYADDILVGGPTRAAHDAALERVLERLDRYGLHLNAAKLQLAKPSVVFFWASMSQKGDSV